MPVKTKKKQQKTHRQSSETGFNIIIPAAPPPGPFCFENLKFIQQFSKNSQILVYNEFLFDIGMGEQCECLETVDAPQGGFSRE